ncbi:murein biosynthesis integral membrane protein MurJ [Sulfurovum sp. XGS-02]|uniref:murein biosynthesis integral membrane protein MurJ n=1 Tax=Sulfurovum sp. XGS-02 TaxID=2925411 RepID=UPI0020697552|nr:murein biosynthesis integral membrane protein MurJ [Sulfurovum sp. XGS-02]UPT78143.1 murein biosynthesis integral membrane protein MurJ [Sulfurovum sp. XGS-02]
MQLKSIFTNSFGILVSRVTGLGRDVLMASALGASMWSDMFFVAFKLPNLFRRIFAEGAFTQAFMPSFVASRHKGVFATAIFLRFLLFLMAFSLLITLFPEPITKLLALGWGSELIAKTAPLTAINFWYLDLIFIVTFLATLLQYKNHFATTAMSTALLNISMIAALYIYMKEEPKTVAYALSFAVLIGGGLQILAHLVTLNKLSLHKILIGGWKYRNSKDVDEEKKHFQSLFLPGILGNSTPQISAFIDTLLATFLVTGSVSYLFYANRVFQLPLAIFAIATATVLFPAVSKALKNNNETDAYKNLNQAFWLLAFLLGGAMVGGILLAEPIIWLLFERGKFTVVQTVETVQVLQMYMVGLLPFGLAKLFSLFLYASHRHLKAAKIAVYSLVTSVTASLILMHPLGASGLALAGSIGGWVLFILTVKEVGTDKFMEIIRSKRSLYWIISVLFFSILLYGVNDYLLEYIR